MGDLESKCLKPKYYVQNFLAPTPSYGNIEISGQQVVEAQLQKPKSGKKYFKIISSTAPTATKCFPYKSFQDCMLECKGPARKLTISEHIDLIIDEYTHTHGLTLANYLLCRKDEDAKLDWSYCYQEYVDELLLCGDKRQGLIIQKLLKIEKQLEYLTALKKENYQAFYDLVMKCRDEEHEISEKSQDFLKHNNFFSIRTAARAFPFSIPTAV